MILLLKLCITPILITAASLAGRRWGPGVSGWLIGFPLTSGPISLILALQNGDAFAAHAAVGTIGGQASVCVFCLTYSLMAQKQPWAISAMAAVAAFLVSTAIWNSFTLSVVPAAAILVVLVALFARIMPRAASTSRPISPPAWDLPARMLIAASFVLLLTSASTTLGPQLSGLISPFPVFGLVLAAFAHHQQGSAAASRLLRGNVIGSLAFGTFFVVVATIVQQLALGWAYLLACLAAIAVNGCLLYLVREAKAG